MGVAIALENSRRQPQMPSPAPSSGIGSPVFSAGPRVRSGHAALTARPTAIPNEISKKRCIATTHSFAARGTSMMTVRVMPA